MNLNDLIPLFVEIVTDDRFKKLGPPFTYHLAEDIKSNVLVKGAMEIDVKGAFPTICRLMYGDESPFVKEIFAIPDKFERNKYIAITMKQAGDRDGISYLADLNLWSKILVMGYIYSRYDDVVVIQYVKDGVLFLGTPREDFGPKGDTFVDYVIKHEVAFHERRIDNFIRFNRTSVITYGKEVSIKGNYKDLPEKLQNEVIPSVLGGGIYDYPLLNAVKKLYSKTHYQILRQASLTDDINKLYMINGKYLNSSGKLDNLSNLDPRSYLRYILYPILALCRLNQNNI